MGEQRSKTATSCPQAAALKIPPVTLVTSPLERLSGAKGVGSYVASNCKYEGECLLKVNARKLRSDMTEEENKLWYQYLRYYPVRFMRQRIIDSFILDFYCARCKLGIELDGKQHITEQGLGHDEARTKLLNAYGVTVIRFTNEQIQNDFGYVREEIDAKVKEMIKAQ